MGHILTLPWVRSKVSVRVKLGSELAAGKGWVGMWPVTRLDPKTEALCWTVTSNRCIGTMHSICTWKGVGRGGVWWWTFKNMFEACGKHRNNNF